MMSFNRMIKLYSGNIAYAVTGLDNWSVLSSTDGSKTMSFDISPFHSAYNAVEEEARVDYDGTIYRIKTINERDSISSVTAETDLDELRCNMFLTFTTETKTLAETLTLALDGTGWSFTGTSGMTTRRSLELTDVTPLDIIKKCTQKTMFNVVLAFDNVNRVISVVAPSQTADNVFFSDQLNLRSMSFKGSSRELVTRLYAFGADELSFADINNGKPYVENFTYTSRVISQVWRDERFTTKNSLLQAAQEKLSKLAVPDRSYLCDVLDIAKLGGYSNFRIGLGSLIILIDRRRKKRMEYHVVEYREYPEEPERNTVTLSLPAHKL